MRNDYSGIDPKTRRWIMAVERRREAIICRYCLTLSAILKAREGKSLAGEKAREWSIKTWDFVVSQCTACDGTARRPIPIEEVINCRA